MTLSLVVVLEPLPPDPAPAGKAAEIRLLGKGDDEGRWVKVPGDGAWSRVRAMIKGDG